MNPSDYRHEYAAYCATLERARYQYHAGLAPELQLDFLRERYADLWTRESIDDLQQAFHHTAPHFETERAGLRALTNLAREGYVLKRSQEVTDELARCEASARITWEGEALAAHEVPERLAMETNVRRRRELARRWFEAVRSCDDLRAARFASLRESCVALGFNHDRLRREEIIQTNLAELAAGAETFLQHTHSVYHSQLAGWAGRELPPDRSDHHRALQFADQSFFTRLKHLDTYFPTRDLRTLYETAMRGLGIHTGKQTNIHVDDEPRPLKKAPAACFAINAPAEIYLVVNPDQPSGARSCKDFFRQAARAQSVAWVSREMASRHPEFIHAPDTATREHNVFLFANLFHDARWLVDQRRLRTSEAEAVAGSFALVELHDARLCCAQLRYFLALHDPSQFTRSEPLAETYVALHTEATGFQYDAATMWLEAENAHRAAENLRARLFAAALRDHLRARYGHRWWMARGAGDELIDMWNTASRYPVEELSRLLMGAGKLDFDLLADDLIRAVNGE